MLIDPLSPLHTLFSLGTGGLFALPLDRKPTQIIALTSLGLPLVVLADRTEELNAVRDTTVKDLGSVHVPCIHHMGFWKQIASCQGFMDLAGLLHICFGRIGGHNMRNQVGQLLITGLCEVHFVPIPTHVSLVPIMGVMIVGRTKGEMRWWQIIFVPQAQSPFLPEKLLDPYPSETFHGWESSEFVSSGSVEHLCEQVQPILADLVHKLLLAIFCCWQSPFFNSATIPLKPGLGDP